VTARSLDIQPRIPTARIVPTAHPRSRTLQERISDGARLFREVKQKHLQAREQAFEAWSNWAIGLRDLLYESDELPSIASLVMVLARQDPQAWSAAQLDSILHILNSWIQSPRPGREKYEAWEDALMDGEIHVRPW